MKRILLWTFDRGSFHWDIMCLLILAFLFLIPRDSFHDVPDFMKVPDTGNIRVSHPNGNTIYTVRLETPVFVDSDETRNMAKGMLQTYLKSPIEPPRTQPIRNWTGRVIGYALWQEKEKP
jgi:hypothetical protein